MCGCRPFIIKIGLLLTIIPIIAVNIMEVIIYGVNSTVAEHQIAKNINIVACFIALLGLSFGVYGTVMDIIFIIRVLMCVMIIFCLYKIVMWIVCKNLSPDLAADVITVWFQLNTGLSIIGSIMTVIFCMYLHEQTRQFRLGY
ncbi:uncharacterized protein LOC120448811 [Drosophila santomea]|uniref:uncharacterized protein LOC120448811 n=1 Tax=Drosophila santomea TaxID=129105 RepID=UPI0019530401|nr:uncharacterized protein LOC120448811 [Drosophila santomea]XP_039486941.1 uncharacterized protein LOC120448811 [Drosophila santomea]